MDRDREWKGRLEIKEEKKKPLCKAQEMSWLLRDISTRKERGQIWMTKEITKPIKENKKVSDI